MSRGKLTVRPITAEGWLSVAAFLAVWILASVAIWVWGHRSGVFSPAFAILATVLVAVLVIVGFWRLVCKRMPRADDQSR